MSLFEQIGMAIALAMDAFAVAICKGLTVKKNKAPSSFNNRTLFWWISGSYAAYRLSFRCKLQPIHRIG